MQSGASDDASRSILVSKIEFSRNNHCDNTPMEHGNVPLCFQSVASLDHFEGACISASKVRVATFFNVSLSSTVGEKLASMAMAESKG